MGGKLGKAECEFCAVVRIECDEASPLAKRSWLDEFGPEREFRAEVRRGVVELLRQGRIVVGKTAIFVKVHLLANREFGSAIRAARKEISVANDIKME